MTTLTKTEAEAILERLADKSLNAGCLVEVTWRAFQRKQTLTYAYSTPKRHYFCEGIALRHHNETQTEGGLKILGHPILIGDVLERIRMARKNTGGGQILSACFSRELAQLEQNARLLTLWSGCSFTSSLQEIAEMIKWDDNWCPLRHYPHNDSCVKKRDSIQTAKPSPQTDLFTYLIQIGL